ncbi:acyloxyacyl hydrolase [Flagellimonas eckloniae]|uniref:Deacylase n=1 Tax=Flagellimonas eckloniae TaxID=346185 RepID=A0A0Q1DIT3_9FLAO|nr:acyloxyacyl hydrolase [Allomuricauda eckloniae]KQC28624.1 hypothetical protein AAY42_00925 [Allomuricauda eckloniae]
MIRCFILCLFCSFFIAKAQTISNGEISNTFKFLEIKSHYGAFLKSDNALGNSGVLDNGYGGITAKLGWQPTDPKGWASRYGYPSYGIGAYVGFLNDAQVFGVPNAVYGFINFPISNSDRKNVFSIEPSLGLTYSLNPFDSEENPINESIGAQAAVYFNLDFGFAYKFSRELDILYGIDVSHFSNGSTFLPNNGLNLYGINLGLRYHYNAEQRKQNQDVFSGDLLPARFNRPTKSPRDITSENALSIYLAGGFSQRDEDQGTNTLYGTGSLILDYEHRFNEMHGVTGGFDLFWDNRLRNFETSERLLSGVHVGYDFMFYKLTVKFQIGTYLSGDRGKGGFFMRPALRYDFNKHIFAQVGLKTLNGGAADYIEYGVGIKPFKW